MAQAAGNESVYNIVPVHDTLADHAALQFPEVRAAIAALQTVGSLARPPYLEWGDGMDLLDWLGAFFGFQADNIKNQREHLALLLANGQMRVNPDPIDKLASEVVSSIRKKVTKNYVDWCKFLEIPSNLSIVDSKYTSSNERLELLYTALYLLIWGEAANLRFMPECLCFVFHNMALELNRILEDRIDERSGQPARPAYCEPGGFLKGVVKPLYTVVSGESMASEHGKAPHSAWRNYDDMNEYFWDKRCLTKLGWPLSQSSRYFVHPQSVVESGSAKIVRSSEHKVGKTGFVEQRSFWNIYQSFDRLWIGLILVLQASIILAWNGKAAPWTELQKKDQIARILSIFITWAGLRLLQALLSMIMQYKLVSAETLSVGVRMVLKFIAAVAWTIIFAVLWSSLWNLRRKEGAGFDWTPESNKRFRNMLYAAAVFVVPEALALLLFIIPWVRNFVENSQWRIFHLLTWWFQTRIYVARGLREGLLDNIRYTLFWVIVIATKFAFSYTLQVKPLIEPTKEIIRLPSGAVKYRWPELFGRGTRSAIVAMWAPVILIYMMDLQIWYTVYSSLAGALVGLFQHLGEIRNVEQLKQRFQYFASALQFTIMAEDQYVSHRRFGHSFWVNIRNSYTRFKLRYGFEDDAYKKEDRQIEAGRFAHIWNEIMAIFREEDLISDRELELLEVPPKAWNISVMQWPSVLLSNAILVALGLCQNFRGNDRQLWRKVARNDYRRCALIECYESAQHVLLRIVAENTEEYLTIKAILDELNLSLQLGTFLKKFDLSQLPNIHKRVAALTKALLKWCEKPQQITRQQVVIALQDLYDALIRDFPRASGTYAELGSGSNVYPTRPGGLMFAADNSVQLPDPLDVTFYKQLKRFDTTLSTKEAILSVPQSLEARRRITFFSNSLFMTMPRAPQVDRMLAFSVLTPYYKETVIYEDWELERKNEDGVSTIYYLQQIFPEDWKNFEERMERQGISKDDLQTSEEGFWFERRLWASYRGQTLARTVRGMMYYSRALEMLAFLDGASEKEVEQVQGMFLRTSKSAAGSNLRPMMEIGQHSSRHASGNLQSIRDKHRATAAMKFTYVAACQVYGQQKADEKKAEERKAEDKKAGVKKVKDVTHPARDILHLMKTYEGLRVAYVDQQRGKEGMNYYSVLVKYDHATQSEVEIYRVQLPGPLILGEGKPENQNHAFIFTRGDAVQTIDMNQENYFEEALKMRNLLQEFTLRHGLRKPTILGVREHVFTGAVSSLAWFMSAQESSFVTLGQRVLATPLKVRMHYGHPDVFDRLWFLTRGGISKASKVINISEDIFAGFNCTERGGNVTHHEYIQVGKGRDVGLNQIALFEAKVASGNGEQILSRDVYRLGHRLDFFRMLSFYYTTVGFFISNMLVVLTVYSFLWGRCYMAISGVEASIVNAKTLDNTSLTASLNQQFLVQMGLFTALPMIVENTLERGFGNAVWEFILMQLQLSAVFFTFSMGTRAHYFGRTVLHGGAKYRATGRGFVVTHEKFAENYRLYSRSHFVKGLELIFLLIVYGSFGDLSKKSSVYILITFSSWFMALTWIMAPFIFNPSGFDWLKTVEDMEDFTRWIFFKETGISDPNLSWETWWDEQQTHFESTGLIGKLAEIILDLRFLWFQYGIVYRLKIAAGNRTIFVYLLSWIYVFVVGAFVKVLSWARVRYSAKEHSVYRLIQLLCFLFALLLFILLVQLTSFEFKDVLISKLAFIPTGWAVIQIAQVLRHPLLEKSGVWPSVVSLARLYEFGMGVVVLVPVAVLSWLPGFQAMQTRILFNEAFSRGLHFKQIVTGRNPNSNYTS